MQKEWLEPEAPKWRGPHFARAGCAIWHAIAQFAHVVNQEVGIGLKGDVAEGWDRVVGRRFPFRRVAAGTSDSVEDILAGDRIKARPATCRWSEQGIVRCQRDA